MTGEYKLYVK